MKKEEKIQEEFLKIQKKYDYLTMKKEVLEKMHAEVLEEMETIHSTKIEDYQKKMTEKLEKSKVEILSQEQNVLFLLNTFVASNLDVSKEYAHCLENLKKLSLFLRKIKGFYNIDTFIELLNQNEKVRSLVKIVVEKNKESIQNKTIEYVIKNESILSLMDAYFVLYENELPKDEIIENSDLTSNSYRQYLKDIGSTPLLTKEEEKELFLKMKKGDKEAKKKIIESNLKLVVNIARRYTQNSSFLLDAIQEGNLGLIKAIEKYDVEKGYKLSTYAPWWIRHAISRAYEEKSLSIRFPNWVYEGLKEYRKCVRILTIELGRDPTIEEIAHRLGKSKEQIEELLSVEASMDIVSTNLPTNEEKSNEIEDFLPSNTESVESVYIKSELNYSIQNYLNSCKLTEREKDILLLRNGFDGEIYSLEEIGKKYGITRERVRQIEAKALFKLRRSSLTKNFLEYMDYPKKAEENLNTILNEYGKSSKNIFRKGYSSHGNSSFMRDKNLMKCIKVELEKEEYHELESLLNEEQNKELKKLLEPIEIVVYVLKKRYRAEYIQYLLNEKEEKIEEILESAIQKIDQQESLSLKRRKKNE